MAVGYYVESKETNPYVNLAMEEYLLRLCEEKGTAILFLWQNDNAVIIGRNQNAYTECNIEYNRIHSICIARRMTGGGAVFHDMGNLNYTIILPKALYNIERSTLLIVSALKSLGIRADINGRNDICINKKKISGNAYYSNEKVGLHHGTILYKVDSSRMEKALSVSKQKLTKHGIHSVKSRVGDIQSEYPNIRIMDIKDVIRKTFCEEYGFAALHDIEIKENAFAVIREKYFSDEWNIEKIKGYEMSVSQCFDWGEICLFLHFEGDKLTDIEIATDALETDLIEKVKLDLNQKIEYTNGQVKETFFEDLSEKNPQYKTMLTDISGLFYRMISEMDKTEF